MAVSANRFRSPSPVSCRSNPKNAEINNGVRRGFTGNPLSKPSISANSPSDFPGRHSIGKEGGVSIHQNEKENETAKALRISSPAVSKGTKNFMFPTISDTPKITGSTRKKVLVERNEMIRTSMSSTSNGRSIISSLNFQVVVEDMNLKPYSSDSTVTDLDQREACSSPSKAYKTKAVLDSQVPKPFSSETLPPYDPHINYLSPRPQFLCYKPNSRIERIRLGRYKQLEDCFSSESSLSDTETTEETQSGDSSSVKMIETAQVEAEVSEARTTEAKVVSKSYSFLRLKTISLLVLLLFVGYYWITITGCSVIDSSFGKELRFTKFYEPAELATAARTNYDGLSRNFRPWSTDTVSYFSKMIPTVKESNEVSVVWFPNFTYSVKEENRLISIAEVGSSVAVSKPESSESKALTENSQSFKELYLSLKEKSSAVNVLGSFLLILILTVTAAFMFAKQQKSPTHSASATPMDRLLAKKLASTPTAIVDKTYQERLSSRNWSAEGDMVGESCPSEMSSFQRTTSYSRKESKGASEAQTQERGLRKCNKRGSLASSSEYSMGSSSYGSYTTYEKVHSKQRGDQEGVSRIQNQVLEFKNDQSCAPYDPINNYLAPRPQFRFYKPNSRLRRMGVEGCLCELCSDIKSNEETRSQISSSVEEWQNEDLEESEATLEETAPVDPNVPESKNDQSCPPYDPIKNYLAPRPQFCFYKPNSHLRKCMEVEECFCKSWSDIESNEGSQSQISSSVEEWQNEDVEEIEATLEETAQVDPNVSEQRATEAKVVSKSYSFFRLKPISLLMLLIVVGCCWITITDSPLICAVIDSTIGKELRFTKLYGPAELAELARTYYEGLTRNFKLWSTNKVYNFSKKVHFLKEPNELSVLWFGNFTDSQVDIVGSVCLVMENQQNLQWPMKEVEIGTVQLTEHVVTEATPEFEKAKLIQEPDQSESEDIREEYHFASHIDNEQASHELEKAKFIQEPDQSESEAIQEEYHISSHINMEHASVEPELEEENLSLKDEYVDPRNLEEQQTKEESKLIPCEAQRIPVEEDQVPEISEVEPKDEELQGKQKLISDPEVVASPIDQEAQVPHVSEIMSELPRAEKLPSENKLISKAEFESSGVVSEPEILESDVSTEYSQSLKQLYLSLEEKPSATEVFLGISLLILVLTAAAAFISRKQHKFPNPSVAAIPIDQFLAKKLPSMATASVENTHQERLSWSTEIAMVGLSCPLKGATSEYLMISPANCKTELKGAIEAQSRKRGMRKSNKRESLASSSEYSKGSTTYGSYTLYERISHKHGCGEEMVKTEVRRSCRIRNMVSAC